MQTLIDFVLHLDKHLADLAQQYGPWTYAILSLILFCETGLVVTPFLPGDSLLFAAGALAASTHGFEVGYLWPCLLVAVFLGDNVNYFMGSRIGRKVFRPNARVLKTEYLNRTEKFYEKYGGRAVILARFVPIVRTYAPFVAGASKMPYRRFLGFSFAGSLLWITLFLFGGYFFGNIPWVKQNFEVVVIAIVLVSVIPAVIEVVKARREKKRAV
ncbi:MAG TPA: DedA family protein [Longimicrobium sp.]|nr:DedA family protein [Longimicrobium sp.]